MKNTFKEELKLLNKKAVKYFKDSNHERNYVHLFRPHNMHKLNIVGSFLEAIEEENKNNNTDKIIDTFSANSAHSFGITAQRDFPFYHDEAFKTDGFYSSLDLFKKEVENNYDKFFCLDENEFKQISKHNSEYNKYSLDEYRKALYARCLIANLWSFRFIVNKCDKANFEQLKNDKAVYITNVKGNSFTLYGIPSINNDNYISIKNDEDEIVQVKINELFNMENKNLYRPINPSLYSGVIPRLYRIDYQKPSIGNNTIEKMTLQLGRTSYMTMAALHLQIADRYVTELLDHPYLTNYFCNNYDSDNQHSLSSICKHFDLMEIKAQERFFNDIQETDSFEKEIEVLNQYFNNSLNVHNINISGNLITSDDYCIYTIRDNNMTDANQYFCSVNGGSEIKDRSVAYYDNSILEDIPTIIYSKEPVYFGSEMAREAIAELGLNENSTFWHYYGLTCMGHINYNNEQNPMWLHFNVLGENNSAYMFESIKNKSKSASEKFENKSILGYKYIIYKDKRSFDSKVTQKILEFFTSNSDIFILIYMLVLSSINVVSDANILHDNKMSTFFKNALTIIANYLEWFTFKTLFKVAAIILIVIKIRKRFFEKKYTKEFHIKAYRDDCIDKFNFFKKRENGNSNTDAIFYILTNIYLLMNIYNDNED